MNTSFASKHLYIMFHRAKKVTLQDPKETAPRETTPLISDPPVSSEEDMDGTENFEEFKADSVRIRRESLAADRLSMRLLQVDDDDSDTEDLILQESIGISFKPKQPDILSAMQEATRQVARERLNTMIGLLVLVFGLIIAALWVGVEFIGPPNQPVGPYQLVERQVRRNYSRKNPFSFIIKIILKLSGACQQSYVRRRETISLIFIPFM